MERRYSPICTYCKYWKQGDQRHCEAFPVGGRYPIPLNLWNGEVSAATGYGHLLPLVGDLHGGKHLLFELDEEVARNLEDPENATRDLLRGELAWLERAKALAAKAKQQQQAKGA